METDYQKMYNNLTVLLQDICQFLNSDKLGSLSHRDKKIVESLITRSKVQLQEISKIQTISVCEEYVDMDSKKDDVNKNVEITVQDEPSCPYDDLPAREASQIVKYGFMYMRRRFLLGFEKMKRVYGAVHNKWLLIYYTEKDLKPICTFNLKNYEAKETDGSKSTNFELMSTLYSKVYYFMALTPKDMLQWVVNINRCHDNVVIQSKEFDLEKNNVSLEEDIGEHYDTVIPASENHNEELEDEEDDIYLELDDIMKPSQNNNKTSQKTTDYDPNIGPPLPRRRPQKDEPVPVSSPLINRLNSSEESLASYDDIKELAKAPEQSSEDDEDATYEAFVHVKHRITKMSNPLPEENKEEMNETTEHSETNNTTIIKRGVTESKNETTVVSIKDKIEKYQTSTAKEDVSIDSEGIPKLNKRNVNLFFQGSIKKSNTPPDVESKNDVNRVNIKSCDNVASESKIIVKGAIGLNPPVIKKVPTVPLKPKVRDRPSIGKRPPFSSFKQITGDR
ncbi:uncharacterized protein LOC108916653 isoform X2 [Anoplophora glabripennis]|uniref:uncharacterized protein LOC108916653 isoform X2 n=1 Tax=Anoplophora glabripennis TaxID=217634 RepID=UPI000874632F|nr:uncharacterized protein LOC108916653 isoform X2 [Anoplophora glabripennis]